MSAGKNSVFRSPFYDNLYMNFFMSDSISRPSCFNCKAKSGRSGSDITVGDYWWINEIHQSFDDDKGCSIVYVNTEKAQTLISEMKSKGVFLKTDTKEEIERAYLFEGAYASTATPNKTRHDVFENLDGKTLEEMRVLSVRVRTMKERMFEAFKDVVRYFGIFDIAKKIYKRYR